jgi:hypothetical protein
VSGLKAAFGALDCSSETTLRPLGALERQGAAKPHPFVSVMLVACSAVVAEACSFAAIGQWARNTPQGTLARARRPHRDGAWCPPGTEHGHDPPPDQPTALAPGGPADLLKYDPTASVAGQNSSARGRVPALRRRVQNRVDFSGDKVARLAGPARWPEQHRK